MNTQRDQQEQAETADHRHVKQDMRRQQDQRDLDIADEDVRNDLADHHLERARRHGQQVFHRAAFALARDRQRR